MSIRTQDTKTENRFQAELYSDIPLDLTVHPNNKQLLRALNERAIMQAFRNLIMIEPYEMPYQKNGSRIRSMLFETPSAAVEKSMADEIKEALRLEPRAHVHSVVVALSSTKREYNITITFSTINNPNPTTVQFALERVR